MNQIEKISAHEMKALIKLMGGGVQGLFAGSYVLRIGFEGKSTTVIRVFQADSIQAL